MVLLDDKKLAEDVKLELKEEVRKMVEAGKRPPHLAAILVGENPVRFETWPCRRQLDSASCSV